MDKNIAQILSLPEEAEKILIGTLYDISVDDGKNNDLSVPDEWTLKKLMEAGFIKDIKAEEISGIQYPHIINEHVVFSEELALNLDNIAASYQATKKRSRVMQADDTLSTIDSLYIKEKEAWYLLEFKNGDWTARDIEKKVHETLLLLNDLEQLDNNAVLTTNRGGQTVEIGELNLKAKLEGNLQFHADSKFYKSKMALYIVYTDRIRKAREFLKLCSQKNRYAEMDRVFKKYGIFRKKIVSPKVDMGHESISALAAYLLQATTENHYYPVYDNAVNMYERWKKINRAPYQKYLTLLKGMPVFISEILKLLSEKGCRLFSGNMSPDEFLIQLAVYSIRHSKEENMPECEADEYDVVMGLLDIFLQKDYLDYASECRSIVQQFGILLCNDRQRLYFIHSQKFTEELQSLINTDFFEALGRLLLIQRMVNKRDCFRLNRQQQGELVQNLLHVRPDEVEAVLDMADNNMESLLKFAALKSYFSKRYTCFWNPGQDDYMHMCRQIYYIKELYGEKQTAGGGTKKQSRQKMRTYGCFGTLLDNLMVKEPPAGFQDKVRAKVNQIEREILAGKSRREIQPLHMAVQETMGSKTIALQSLKYSFEGSQFKRVEGCRGEDFGRVLGKGSCPGIC